MFEITFPTAKIFVYILSFLINGLQMIILSIKLNMRSGNGAFRVFYRDQF